MKQMQSYLFYLKGVRTVALSVFGVWGEFPKRKYEVVRHNFVDVSSQYDKCISTHMTIAGKFAPSNKKIKYEKSYL